MKNRIISLALAFVLLFTSIIAVMPLTAAAASASVDVKVTAPDPEIDAKIVLEDYKKVQPYNNAEEMLQDELSKGYLDSVKFGNYELYVNKYIGTVYYKNVVTGQVLTSNPYDHNKASAAKEESIYGQIEIEYMSLSDSSASGAKYYSSEWIAKGFDLELTALDNGISVKYSLGYDIADILAPAAIMRDDYNTYFAHPMFEDLAALLEENCGAIPGEGIKTQRGQLLTSYNIAECDATRTQRYGCYDRNRVYQCTEAYLAYAREILSSNDDRYIKIMDYCSGINGFFQNYEMRSVASLKDADGNFHSDIEANQYSQWNELMPNLANDMDAAAYIIKSHTELSSYAIVSSAVRNTLGRDITIDIVNECVERTGYETSIDSSPFFILSIVYTLDEQGALCVSVPTDADSIDYNSEFYAINAITPLKYFGCGSLTFDGRANEGYAFLPDGSGAVVEFADIAKINASISSKIYGQDSCYSYIGLVKPNEQVTMPVYGLVNEENAADSMVANGVNSIVNGYFSIIEEGASMASISLFSSNSSGKVCAYNSFSPYPSDRYDLSQTLSVGSTSFYNMVAKTSYQGKCTTKITMLTDDSLAQALGITSYYPSTYVGMASCYKDYLKAKGVLGSIIETSEDLPLYIEALGSIDVIEKILTFPVTVSTPLTSFGDVEQMYLDFIDAAATLKARAEAERAAAAELEGEIGSDVEDRIRTHLKNAEKYEALVDKVDSILNVNFKLTGFSNGGMHFTYPAKLKWERSVGGKKGFASLVETADSYNQNAQYNLGIYPDFDFLYISNTAAFDGIGLNKSAARLVDNRYASQQSWNSLINVNGTFESNFTLLAKPTELDRLFDKFNQKYSKFGHNAISVSTLGSNLNSDFDEDTPTNREDALGYVKNLLSKMANSNNYSLMTDVGNIYAVEYVDHIVNASIDSSHLKNTSYTIPFYGLVLHGYVNYAGTPINYSGSPDYDILRSIENGASLYYILCCQNTNRLKEDPTLSKHYGIDYNNWYEKILVQYKELNDAIGALQRYEIVDHRTIIAERIIDSDETAANYVRLVNELINDKIDVRLRAKLDKALADIRNSENYTDYIGKPLNIFIDKASIAAVATTVTNLSEQELDEYGFSAGLDAVAAIYAGEGYNVTFGTTAETGLDYISFTSADILDNGAYKSVYDYVTDSGAIDTDYDYTDFTCDNSNVVMVKYRDASTGKEQVFFLNYNMFAVTITIDNRIDKTLADGERKTFTVSGLDFAKLYEDKAGR